MKPTVQQFEKIITDRFDRDYDGIRWHGEYHGRFFYHGVAVAVRDTADVVEILDAVREAGFKLGKNDHTDNLGFDYIIAWRYSKFNEGETEVSADVSLTEGAA